MGWDGTGRDGTTSWLGEGIAVPVTVTRDFKGTRCKYRRTVRESPRESRAALSFQWYLSWWPVVGTWARATVWVDCR
jgi:hypothetical protein